MNSPRVGQIYIDTTAEGRNWLKFALKSLIYELLLYLNIIIFKIRIFHTKIKALEHTTCKFPTFEPVSSSVGNDRNSQNLRKMYSTHIS